jgi:hypothetical protein
MLFTTKKPFEAARESNVTLIIQVNDNQETPRKQLEHGMKIQKPVDRFKSEWECEVLWVCQIDLQTSFACYNQQYIGSHNYTFFLGYFVHLIRF